MRGSYEPVPAFSATRASGCSFQNATSVLRAMTLMVVYIMFPFWEQA